MRLQAARALTFLGFSDIEARVYCFLLEESPATGYRVSHGIGKPTANTYKAIAALALRGAIIIDDGESRLCRAVPPDELLERLDRDFETRKRAAESELSKIRQAEGDDRVYYLTTVEQVVERARSMLKSAERAALLELFPRTVAFLAADLEAAAKRGVKVAVKTYEPVKLGGVAVINAKQAARVLGVWPGQQISIAVDGEQFLTALLSKDATAVHQALWSNSTFLSCFYYNALNVEHVLTEVEGKGASSALDAMSLTRLKPPGFQKLNERYGESAPKAARRRK